jgi:hypothetical protein
MKITRNVILDLLPMFLADEVSADTKALVEEYLETDPDLANTAKKLAPLEKPAVIPQPLSRDAEVMAYKKARWMQLVIVLVIAGVLSMLLVFTLFVFFFGTS